MKNILITGKTGTVGRNLHFGSGFPSNIHDLRSPIQTKEMFDKMGKLDGVIHCAARVGGLGFHLHNKYSLFYDNIMMNTNIINECKNRGIDRVLSFLSSCIFSDVAKPPYDESMIHEGPPFDVHYPYGQAKRTLEIQSRICYEELGLKYNCIIPTNIYGIDDNFNMENGHVVAVLIHRAYLAFKEGTNFTVWGNGKQQRDFIFTKDIANLTEWAFENYLEKEPLIFSNNNPVEIGTIAEIIADHFGIKDRLKFDTSQPSGQQIRRLSGNKLNELIDFKFTSIEDGLRQSIQWFLDNYPNVRL